MTTSLWVLLGWLSLPVLGILAGVCVWRKTYRELPLFSLYVVTAFLIGAVRLLAYKLGSSRTYFYVYWYSNFISVVAALLAIYEVFLRRIFPSFYKVRFYRVLFPAALFLIALFAFIAAVGASSRNTAFALTSRSLDFLRTAVIGFFAALALLMGRRFSGREFWVAAGFGIQAAIALAHAAVRSRFSQLAGWMGWAELITYDLVCIVWVAVFWNSLETDTHSYELSDTAVLHEARTWESMLKAWLNPRK